MWKEMREVGLHVLPACARFGLDRRLVSFFLVRTNQTLDILVSHTLHATVSTQPTNQLGRGRVRGVEGLRIWNGELVISRETPSCYCLVRVASGLSCIVQ